MNVQEQILALQMMNRRRDAYWSRDVYAAMEAVEQRRKAQRRERFRLNPGPVVDLTPVRKLAATVLGWLF